MNEISNGYKTIIRKASDGLAYQGGFLLHFQIDNGQIFLCHGLPTNNPTYHWNTIPLTILSLNANQWYHLVVSYNRSENKAYCYMNNQYVGFIDHTVYQPISNSLNMSIGIKSSYSQIDQFKGKLDDIRIYNRTLSVTEINALYHEGGW